MLSKRTCALTFWCQLLGSLLAAKDASAATATFRNQCGFEISVYDNHSSCQLGAGGPVFATSGCDRSINHSSVYRHGASSEATLAEFSFGDNKVWYDLSTVPPGAMSCDSYEACAKQTGNEGFNVGVMIEPVSPNDDSAFACSSLLCQFAECPDASRFPSDESKIRNCPEQQHFNITFCP
ncbi:hypothetical protein PHYPSEUDO_012407 [Phytophthora pseudosyringae]|uniref:Thaumatin-like protein n=1 Tax=Phytophthora pseudosyringae TaxID=221518 RepID=A0A8T1WFY3_9STRA|nr:hypothetical protein PHYPSEUDO_012407 [Phytophthora pseudosyringae]